MISLYSGTPGSGKSLHLASIIFNRCRHKVLTIGNFDVNRDVLENDEYYEFVDNEFLCPYILYERSVHYFEDEGRKFKEGAILLIIDEAQLLFNVREWNLKGRNQWIHFFTQHRKLGFDIIIVSQFDKMIDKQLRALFEYEFIHRKMSNFGFRGKFIAMFTGNRLFICVQMWYPLKERIGSESFLYKKVLGELYNTRLMFERPDFYKEGENSIEADNYIKAFARNNNTDRKISDQVEDVFIEWSDIDEL